MNLKEIFDELCKGNLSIITLETKKFISDKAMSMYLSENTENFAEDLKYLIMICNILYNRTSMEVLPVEDGVYDILLERYKTIDPNFQVGSAVVMFKNQAYHTMVSEGEARPKEPFHFVDISVYQKDENRLYFRDQIQKYGTIYPYCFYIQDNQLMALVKKM